MVYDEKLGLNTNAVEKREPFDLSKGSLFLNPIL
ncbi:MAG: hypothetical protein ACJA0X_002923 [Cyclobacteriaceae bacterium]|jgi:hypothetical protein